MQLLIEAGNTYVKVALLTQNEQIEQIGKFPSKKLELVLQPLLEGNVERIVFARLPY